MAGAPGVAEATQPAIIASAAGATSDRAASSAPADPAPPPRRRFGSLRQWIAGRGRDKQAVAPTNPTVPAQPPAGTAVARGEPQSGMDGPPLVSPVTPQPGAIAAPPADAGTRPPAPSEQRPVPPGNEGPNSDLAPSPPPPVDAVANDRMPRRDPMLAQVGWSRMPIAAAKIETGFPERPSSAAEDSASFPDSRLRRVVAGPRRHTIATGDTFASIARSYYGSDRLAEPLREFNRGRIGRGGLRPGDLLVIPPREELPSVGGWVVQAPARPAFKRVTADAVAETTPSRPVRRGLAASASGPIDPAEFRPASATERPRARTRAVYHVVGPDETPRSIARDRLGDARRADEIVNLNHGLLAAEGRWRPGLRILLPPDAQ